MNLVSSLVVLLLCPLARGQSTLTGPVVPEASPGRDQVPAATCPLVKASNICLTLPPYNASTSGAISTTTSAPVAVSATAIPVTSSSSFAKGQGIAIAGAGPSAVLYIGKVEGISGNTITVSPSTATRISKGATVQHDETAAFQAAINSLTTATAGAGNFAHIYLPTGTYLVNGPLLQKDGANAILPLPQIPNYTTPLTFLQISGTDRPDWDTQATGAVIRSSQTSGSLFGGYDSARGGGYPPFTNVKLELDNLTIFVGGNMTAVNASSLQAFDGEHLLLIGGGNSGTGTGILMPSLLNEVQNALDDVQVASFGTGYVLTEHTRAGRIYASSNGTGIKFDTGANGTAPPTYGGNGIAVDYLWAASNDRQLSAGSNPTVLNILVADLETPNVGGYDIYDPSNLLHGIINYNNPYNLDPAHNSTGRCTIPISGGLNLAMNALYCLGSSASVSGAMGTPDRNSAHSVSLSSGKMSITANAAQVTAVGFVTTLAGTGSKAVIMPRTDARFTVTATLHSAIRKELAFSFVTFESPWANGPNCQVTPLENGSNAMAQIGLEFYNGSLFLSTLSSGLPAGVYVWNISCAE